MYAQALVKISNYYNNIKKDRGNNPYSKHISYILDHLETEEQKLVGMFHSVLEDHIKTKEGKIIDINELKKWRLSDSIIKSIIILTRLEGENYNDYIDRIIDSDDINAIKVKFYALEDNLHLERIPNPTQEDIDNIKNKCEPHYEKLKKKLGELDDRYKIDKRK